jgi:UDP-3-O-[3-hydroxymyristoyl] glucosamine N-acyltransferase
VIGAHTVVAGCTGISGSARIGKHCVIGGGVGIVGHVEICDGVTISGFSLVAKSILKPGTYTAGMPLMPHAQWLRNAAHLRRLDEIVTGRRKEAGEDRERNDD